jgi:hypothetical protein
LRILSIFSISKTFPNLRNSLRIIMASTQVYFHPKQMFPKTAALFEAIIGTTSEDTNKHIFTQLLPPFPPDSLIHDNGCGSGQVTSEIVATNPPSSIRIIATDANKYVLDLSCHLNDCQSWCFQSFRCHLHASLPVRYSQFFFLSC